MTSGTTGEEREPKVIPLREAVSVVLLFTGDAMVWIGLIEAIGRAGLMIMCGLHVIIVAVIFGLARNAPAPSVQPPTTRMEVRPRRPEDGPAHNHS